MKINSTASYSPSYTANYGAAQAAQRKEQTKVHVKADSSDNQASSAAQRFEARRATMAKEPGTHFNAKA